MTRAGPSIKSNASQDPDILPSMPSIESSQADPIKPIPLQSIGQIMTCPQSGLTSEIRH